MTPGYNSQTLRNTSKYHNMAIHKVRRNSVLEKDWLSIATSQPPGNAERKVS
jgi:hypothetical protein